MTINRVQVEIVGRDVSGGATLRKLGDDAQLAERKVISLDARFAAAKRTVAGLSKEVAGAGVATRSTTSALGAAFASGGWVYPAFALVTVGATLFADAIRKGGEEAEKAKQKIRDAFTDEVDAITKANDALIEQNRLRGIVLAGGTEIGAKAADRAADADRLAAEARGTLAKKNIELANTEAMVAEATAAGADAVSTSGMLAAQTRVREAVRRKKTLQDEIFVLKEDVDRLQDEAEKARHAAATSADLTGEKGKPKGPPPRLGRQVTEAADRELALRLASLKKFAKDAEDYDRASAMRIMEEREAPAKALAQFEQTAAEEKIALDEATWKYRQEQFQKGLAATKAAQEKEIQEAEQLREQWGRAGLNAGMTFADSFFNALGAAKRGDKAGAASALGRGLLSLVGMGIGSFLGPVGASIGGQLGAGLGNALFHTGGTADTGTYVRQQKTIRVAGGEGIFDPGTTAAIGGAQAVEDANRTKGASLGGGHTVNMGGIHVAINGNASGSVIQQLRRELVIQGDSLSRALAQVLQKQTGLRLANT